MFIINRNAKPNSNNNSRGQNGNDAGLKLRIRDPESYTNDWVIFNDDDTYGLSFRNKLYLTELAGEEELSLGSAQLNLTREGELQVSNKISFGSRTGQHINLYGTSYGIGIESSTQYFKTASQFKWYKGSATQMILDANGNLGIGRTPNANYKLDVNGTINASNIRVGGTLIQDLPGNKGDTGPQGLRGLTGLQGPAGPQGPQGDSFWNPSGDNIYFNTGNVGIGRVPNASFKLDVNGTINATAVKSGNLNLGTWPVSSDYSYFQHSSLSNIVGNYALLQHSGGTTYLNTSSGKNIYFRVNNATQMTMNTTGLGIGTSPSSGNKLDVNGKALIRGILKTNSDLEVGGDAQISNDMTVNGDLNVAGSFSISEITGLNKINNIDIETTSDNSFFFGQNAGANYSGTNGQNLFIGEDAGKSNITGYGSVALGFKALEYDKYSWRNMAIGAWALNETGKFSTATDKYDYNTAIGYDAGRHASRTKYSTYIGSDAGRADKWGNLNTFIGSETAEKMGDASTSHAQSQENTVIGSRAFRNATKGSGNVLIGSQVAASVTEINNELWIDNSNTSTPLIWGNFAQNKLKINGNMEVTGTLTATNIGGTLIEDKIETALSNIKFDVDENDDSPGGRLGKIFRDQISAAVTGAAAGAAAGATAGAAAAQAAIAKAAAEGLAENVADELEDAAENNKPVTVWKKTLTGIKYTRASRNVVIGNTSLIASANKDNHLSLKVNGKTVVDGNLVAKKIAVAPDPTIFDTWADYVFADDYDLRSLSDLESFIKTNKHLPEVPSAKEVAENGLDLFKMDATLLQKTEELTLYTIAQEKKIDALTKKLEKQDKQLQEMDALKKRMERLEALLVKDNK